MKTNNIARVYAIAAVAALAMFLAPAANAQGKGCSNASLQGTFGYTSVGSIVAAPLPPIIGPSAEVGMLQFDGKGGVSFTFAASINGSVGPGTATGAYTVNSDCTGTFTEVTPMFTSHFFFVIDNSWNEFQAICQDSGVVSTRIGHRLYPGVDI